MTSPVKKSHGGRRTARKRSPNGEGGGKATAPAPKGLIGQAQGIANPAEGSGNGPAPGLNNGLAPIGKNAGRNRRGVHHPAKDVAVAIDLAEGSGDAEAIVM